MTVLDDAVQLGLSAESFLGSPLGKFLVGRAEGEIEEAVEKLKTTDPEDAKAIRDLQNRIYRAESVQYWLAEAIMTGENAQQELLDERTQD